MQCSCSTSSYSSSYSSAPLFVPCLRSTSAAASYFPSSARSKGVRPTWGHCRRNMLENWRTWKWIWVQRICAIMSSVKKYLGDKIYKFLCSAGAGSRWKNYKAWLQITCAEMLCLVRMCVCVCVRVCSCEFAGEGGREGRRGRGRDKRR